MQILTTTLLKVTCGDFIVPADPSFNHIPSPATIISPALGSRFNGITTIDLKWNVATDLDNDIVGYELYCSKNKNPDIVNLNITHNIFSSNISVTAGTYYWQLVTKDSRGNKASTDIFYFIVD